MTEPRPLLGGRFSLERPLLSSPGEQRWMAIEARSGRLVVIALVDPGRLSTLAQGVSHRHLASVIDVVREVGSGSFPASVTLPTGAAAAVAEHKPGRSLRGMLERGPLHPAKAVAWALRLADAVQAIHAAGGVHGAISPRSVIAEPEGRAIAPVLSQLIAPPLAAFCPPERLRGAPESASDDVWALCATLYAALTGKPPFAGTTRDALQKALLTRPEPLFSVGVTEPVLQEIITRGLLPDRRQRALDLGELQAALDGWEREPTRMPPPRPPPRPAPRGLGDIVVGTAFGSTRDDGLVVDDASLPDDQGERPPSAPPEPLPAPSVPPPPLAAPAVPVSLAAEPGPAPVRAVSADAPKPAVPRRVSFNPFERKRAIWPWLVVAALGGGGGVYLALVPSSPPQKAEPVATETAVARPVAPKPTVRRNADLVRNECVTQHFPAGSFDGTPDFAFVCEDQSFPQTARRLHTMVIPKATDVAPDAGAPGDAGLHVNVVRISGGRELDGGVRGPGLDWYELPATAIIRRTCCPNASPVILPQTPGWCEQLEAVVRRIAEDSAKSVDLGPGARSFDKAVGCLFAGRVKHGYSYLVPPTAASRAVFQQFLSRAAIVSTRR